MQKRWVAIFTLLMFSIIPATMIFAAGNNVLDTKFQAEDAADFEDEFEDQLEFQVFDPISGYNRVITIFNDKFYFWLLKPIAKGYGFVVPKVARVAVYRCFNNILFPVRFVNNLLQLKFKQVGVETARFGINSTLGIAGLGDPALMWFDLNPYDEDLGQTLGHYGLGSGFYIVWPLLGPSNLRDTVGMVGDFFLDPINYINNKYVATGLHSYDKVNYTSLHIGDYESLKKDAIDFYTLLRDSYEQKREKEIEE
jgi:phospholipid-binding lipoprotein MlaA